MGRALGEDSYLSRMVRDPGGSGRLHHEVGIRCRKCAREAWASAPTPGWGRRLFKTKGWDCGNGLARHTCPDCLAGKTRLPATQRKKAADVSAGILELAAPLLQAVDSLEQPLPEAEIHHLPEPDRPIIHVHNPEHEHREELMTSTAMAEALAPVKVSSTGKVIRARGAPNGFTTNGNCAKAARDALVRMGVSNPQWNEHYRTVQESDGSWSYELIGRETRGIGPGGGGGRFGPMKIVEGHRVSRRDGCERSAISACHRRGVGEPQEGLDFEILGSPGEGYVYRLLERPKHATSGDGFLSRFDAKKAAFSTLAPHRKSGGAPQENVDYWVTQNGFNMWAWTTTNPDPTNQPQSQPLQQQEKKVGDVVPIAQEPRKPSLAENRKIMEALDANYDAERQRYKASTTDTSLGEKLNLPRAWISRVRDEFYGPEANEADAEAMRLKLAALDKGVALAERAIAAATRAMDAAAEAETLLGELKAWRAEAGQ